MKYKWLKTGALLLFMLAGLTAQLVNPNSTEETRKLKAYLDSVYGHKIISGQMDDSYLDYIVQTTGGKMPAMMGYDFNGVCPSQGGNHDAAKAIDWVINKGGVAQFQWHWISPNADGDFYSDNFKLDQALADTNSSSYKNMLRDIDLVAVEIQKMQVAGVPILWRPLHEAEGKWFWWGMSGGEACKKLYRLIYDRFVNYHNLNNLIWVWTSYGKTKENWYPGDDVVDIIVWDYPNYSNNNGSWQQYQELFGEKGKLLGIGEDGLVTDPDILDEQPWLYFMTWAYMVKDPSQNNGKNPKDWLSRVYNDPRVITLEDLQPGLKVYAGISQTIFDMDGDGVETVTLDGSGSYSDSSEIVSYVWTENGNEIAIGEKAEVEFGLGEHDITLTVTTDDDETKSATVKISIRKVTLAFMKEVRASSVEGGSGNVAANAVDGRLDTRWASSYSDMQWYAIDLGQNYKISRVVLHWEAASAKDYSIQVSDNAMSWTDIVIKNNMAEGARVDSLLNLNGEGRFIRMNGVGRTSEYGYSIYEFEVWGEPVTTNLKDDFETGAIYYELWQNYPNPFNPTTSIKYTIAEVSNVRIDIFNQLGQQVSRLVDDVCQPGHYAAEFNAENLPSGLYFYRLEAKNFKQIKKMHLVK